MSDGQDYLDARSVSEDVYVRVSEGTDSVYLGEGDDIIEVRGSFDMVLDAGSGDNVLALPGLDVPDVSLRVSGEDIILEGKRGTILMRRQYPRSGESAPIKQMIFRNRTLYASDIYTKAIDGQATDGDDVLTGTPGNDVIYPGRGNDKISALEGDDAIFYEGGNDIIMGSLEGVGEDTLSFPFNRSEVQVTSVGDRDMKIITPRGSVTLQFQVFFPVGNDRSNIEKFIFKDGIYLDADMRSSIDK
jgi:Ca2+-binding RTX toxin-like protein